MSPDKHDRALELLQSNDLSLPEIAAALGVSLRTLTRFLNSHDGLTLVAEVELAHAVRVRACAAAHLHQVAGALSLILKNFTQSNSADDNPRRALRDQPSRERRSESARRAAHLLFRLAHFNPRPIRVYVPVLHGEAVEVNSRGSPRSGTPGEALDMDPHRAAVLVPCDARGVIEVQNGDAEPADSNGHTWPMSMHGTNGAAHFYPPSAGLQPAHDITASCLDASCPDASPASTTLAAPTPNHASSPAHLPTSSPAHASPSHPSPPHSPALHSVSPSLRLSVSSPPSLIASGTPP